MTRLLRLWHRHSPQVFLGELLEKRWMEPVIPFVLMVALFTAFAVYIPGYTDLVNLRQLALSFAEQAMVAVAMAVVVLSGGIDLSVGSVFAMANFLALYLHMVLGLPLPLTVPIVLAFGALVGLANGALIAYGRTRSFLTTLVSLIILRGLYNQFTSLNTDALASVSSDSPMWDFIGAGLVLGIPVNVAMLMVLAVVMHLFFTRIRPGLHIMAVGSSRKAARHAGVDVRRVQCSAYVLSATIAALAGIFYAARQNSAGTDTGVGWEINALSAVVLGGISLAGGRGTIARAMMGSAIIFMLVSGLVRMGISGNVTTALIGGVLLLAVAFNVKWVKNKGKVQQKVYVVPSWVDFTAPPSIAPDSGTPFARNARLRHAEAIGLGQIEGPEDIIFDRHDRLYAVTRNGAIMRFLPPDYTDCEAFARIGGRPLGMAFDQDANLIVCVAGMGVYGVRPDRTVFKVTDRTSRSPLRLKDDSRLMLADDLDIAPDGKIWFSEASTRYDLSAWALDGFEGRGNGRLICHDPHTGTTRTVLRNLTFPNGVCIAHDGRSVLWASTWLCQVNRYWLVGEKAGQTEVLIDNLPGYCDNINRASDGTYWLALVGLRSPVYDLAMANPGFRSRMVRQLPPDEWLCPAINYGCILKFDDQGTVRESLWDPEGLAHPTITSVREHKGWLYIGGLENNRIGRVPLPNADPDWQGWNSYWGAAH